MQRKKFSTTRFRMMSLAAGTAIKLCLLAIPATAAGTADKVHLFGIVPQQSASRLAQIWVPMLDRLSQETGLTIRFATTKDIPTFEACLAQGAYEFAYMNPYHYTVYSKVPGYRAFAKQAKKKLRGILVVRKDSTARSIDDLDESELAFPSPAAFGASVLPRAEMRAKGIAHRPKYVKSHDSVYRAVAAGIYPAGGGVLRTFGNIGPDLRDQLRVIYRTDAYTPHAFAAHPAVAAADRDRVAQAMVQLGVAGGALMTSLGMKGIAAADDADWNDVRALGLTKDQTEIVNSGGVQCRSD